MTNMDGKFTMNKENRIDPKKLFWDTPACNFFYQRVHVSDFDIRIPVCKIERYSSANCSRNCYVLIYFVHFVSL